MSDPRQTAERSWTPWLVAVVAAVVFAAGIIVYYAPLSNARSSTSVGDLTSSEQAAMTAATTETVNLLSYRRAKFNSDYARAVAGASGSLKKDIASSKATTLSTLTKGKFDLSARVTHQAFVGPAGKNSYQILVSVNGYKSTTPDVPTQQNLQVTVAKTNGKWLVTDVKNVGVS